MLTILNCYAPNYNKEMAERNKELYRIALVSKSIDINHIGILNIPLNPFVERDNVKEFNITSKYGYRKHPILKAVLLHSGIDVIVNKNEPIMASGNGIVVKVSNSKYGYGNHIIIKHNNELKTLYAHLNKVLVKEGDYVRSGDVIGLGGQTGLVWGKSCHLHFELRQNDIPINPMKFINAKTTIDFITKMHDIKDVNDFYLE